MNSILEKTPQIMTAKKNPVKSDEDVIRAAAAMARGMLLSPHYEEIGDELAVAGALVNWNVPEKELRQGAEPRDRLYILSDEVLAVPAYDYSTQTLAPANSATYSPTWLRPDEARLYRLSNPVLRTTNLGNELDFLSLDENRLLESFFGRNTARFDETGLLRTWNHFKLLREQLQKPIIATTTLPLDSGTNPDLDDRVLVLGQFGGDEKDVLLPVVVCSKY
jgi:hypothetical protein